MKLNLKTGAFPKHEAMLKTRLEERIPVEYKEGGLTIEFKIDDSFCKKESYKIEETSQDNWLVTGADEMGLYHGVGKFLHSAKWTEETFSPVATKGVIAPDCSFRSVYVCCHFHNFYEEAPEDVLTRYLEDLLLWGYNVVHAIVPLTYKSFEDPAFLRASNKVRTVYKLAKQVGMKTCLCILPNQGLISAPQEYNNDPNFDQTLRGNSDRNLCLSKPDAWNYMEGLWDGMLSIFTDIGLDYIMTWPYDEGGCGCEKCRPWGANMYCTGSRGVRDVALKYYPDAKFILSTWCFDVASDEGEYSGLYERMKGDMSYLDYIMVDAHEQFPRYPLEHEVITPVVNFPEISMWALYPWGGFGANPLLERFDGIWNSSKHILDGGSPYSEGIYEDISKIQFAGYYWNKDVSYKETMAEYINYEYQESVTEDALELMLLIEKNHALIADKKDPDMKAADRAKELAEKIDAELCERAKKAWRWRILYIRAILDYKRYHVFMSKERTERDYIAFLHYSGDLVIADKEAQDLFRELWAYFYTTSTTTLINAWTMPPLGGTPIEPGWSF